MKYAILNDLTKCIGCGACASACEEINGLPPQDKPSKLSSNAWTAIRTERGVNIRQQCMHCVDPACVSVCPVTALQKTPEGPVIYDETRCIGCRYCMLACPFGVPTYQWDSTLPKMQKCIMCYEKRVKEGKQPACTSVCPTGATVFGEREDLIRQAQNRIDHGRGRYVNHIYGLKEAGGTSVLYISPLPFEELGFKTQVQEAPYPKLTWAVLSKIPNIVGIGGVLMIGIYWVINRRITLAHTHHHPESVEPPKRRKDANGVDIVSGD
jgi:formate dehydrogenase iron-sulfur subunit